VAAGRPGRRPGGMPATKGTGPRPAAPRGGGLLLRDTPGPVPVDHSATPGMVPAFLLEGQDAAPAGCSAVVGRATVHRLGGPCPAPEHGSILVVAFGKFG